MPVIDAQVAERLSANARALLQQLAAEMADAEQREFGLRVEVARMQREGWSYARLRYERVKFTNRLA